MVTIGNFCPVVEKNIFQLTIFAIFADARSFLSLRYPGLLAKASPIFVAAIASPEDISKSIVESRLLYHKISLYKIANAMTKR